MSAMGVQETLEILKKAQELDSRIYQIKLQIEATPEMLEELEEAFQREKSRLAQLEHELKEAQLRQKQKEGELAEKENLIRKYDAQLAQVKTNKEYSALQQEMANLKADNSLLEDQILGFLEETEKATRAVQEERGRLASVEKETQSKKKVLEDKKREQSEELKKLKEERNQIITHVHPEARSLYERIVEKKQGVALVPVQGESCGACQITLRPQILNEVKLKDSLVVCDNCSRLLYSAE